MRAPRLILSWISACLLFGGLAAVAAERFPPPDFSAGYEMPSATTPPPRAASFEALDLAALILALSLASWFALRSRSRRGLYWLSLASLAYFGFYRGGCVCPIGAIQNVALGLFRPEYLVPLGVLAFFGLPLLTALLFGRTFCSAVCPLGAIQDLVLVHPMKVSRPLEDALGLLAHVYLGLAVLFSATGSAFIICEYDPFVAFFRSSGSAPMLLLGVAFLVAGIFVGRPYCRFLCPYGVILGWISRFSRYSVSITPKTCTRCRLCEDACPFGAIEVGVRDEAAPSRGRARGGLVRLAALVILLPLFAAGGAFLGRFAAPALARVHATVSLAERVSLEAAGKVEGSTDASKAFRSSGRPLEELQAEARSVVDRFRFGSGFLGAFLGLVLAGRILSVVLERAPSDYVARRSTCLACGRCYLYCPEEHTRLKDRGVLIEPADVVRQL